MLLRSQVPVYKQDYKLTDRSVVLRRAVIATCIAGGAVVLTAFDASAADSIDILTSALTVLPTKTLEVYTGLKLVVPFAVGLAAALAAAKGGMGYVISLVRAVIH